MEKLERNFIFALLIGILCLIGYNIWQKNDYEKKMDELYNKLARTAETIKLRDGEYEKLMEKQKDLLKAIDQTTEQGKDLARRLDRADAKLLSVTNVNVQIKDEVLKLRDLINKPRTDGSWEFAVKKDQGLLGVDGSCFSGPTKDNASGCDLKLSVKPWTFSQVVNQKEDGSWAVDAVVPPEVALNFGRTVVNPRVLNQPWYTGLNGTLQLGLTRRQYNLGIGYKFKNWNVGPYASFDDKTTYGASVTWFPLEK